MGWSKIEVNYSMSACQGLNYLFINIFIIIIYSSARFYLRTLECNNQNPKILFYFNTILDYPAPPRFFEKLNESLQR